MVVQKSNFEGKNMGEKTKVLGHSMLAGTK